MRQTETDSEFISQTDRHTVSQSDRHTAVGETDRATDRQTYICTLLNGFRSHSSIHFDVQILVLLPQKLHLKNTGRCCRHWGILSMKTPKTRPG